MLAFVSDQQSHLEIVAVKRPSKSALEKVMAINAVMPSPTVWRQDRAGDASDVARDPRLHGNHMHISPTRCCLGNLIA